MWAKIYGGSSFPFVTTVHVSVVLVLGVLAGLAALIWRFI